MQRTWTQGKSASSGLLHNCTQFLMSWAPKAGLEICYVEFGKLCLMTVRNIHNVRASLLTPEKAFFLSSMASEPHAPPPMPSCLLTPSSCWSSQADSPLPGLTRLFPSQDFALSPMPLLWVPNQGGCLFPFKEIFTGHSPPWHHPWFIFTLSTFSFSVTTLDTVHVYSWSPPPGRGLLWAEVLLSFSLCLLSAQRMAWDTERLSRKQCWMGPILGNIS